MEKEAKKNKFSTSEVGAFIENLRAEIKPILEGIPDIKKKLDGIFEQVGKNTETLGTFETVFRRSAEKIEINRQLITRVLEELKSKVDRKDFETLEKNSPHSPPKIPSLMSFSIEEQLRQCAIKPFCNVGKGDSFYPFYPAYFLP